MGFGFSRHGSRKRLFTWQWLRSDCQNTCLVRGIDALSSGIDGTENVRGDPLSIVECCLQVVELVLCQLQLRRQHGCENYKFYFV